MKLPSWALVVIGVLVPGGALAASALWWRQRRRGKAMVTLDQLAQVMPAGAKAGRLESNLPHLLAAMREAEISTPRRAAAFLAQLALESGEFRWFEELASGEAYEGRRDLGNTEPGDGRRFKGRGPIQLTGRANYAAAGRALDLPLEARPELAATPAAGFRVAAWYWRTRGLNDLADRGDFREITRRINGGYNGLAQREAYYAAALAAIIGGAA